MNTKMFSYSQTSIQNVCCWIERLLHIPVYFYENSVKSSWISTKCSQIFMKFSRNSNENSSKCFHENMLWYTHMISSTANLLQPNMSNMLNLIIAFIVFVNESHINLNFLYFISQHETTLIFRKYFFFRNQ